MSDDNTVPPVTRTSHATRRQASSVSQNQKTARELMEYWHLENALQDVDVDIQEDDLDEYD